ncbi:hypothetical protein L3N51_00479 [Metallosphaera sp. J1]|uniref:hypothetical protein n=1 Tax=Metallosphaera javensis (ex Hofmann et al. 2022) TaxID=99938 RepID=UPI001EDECE61|nr:hypothetical protein [Metallosphaera javensis (ex Hofmann et al. 2022)]MCG3108198.1 hypothetical protein [Metallosphaera javensis (ex Hofmann et al. 2022)]
MLLVSYPHVDNGDAVSLNVVIGGAGIRLSPLDQFMNPSENKNFIFFRVTLIFDEK